MNDSKIKKAVIREDLLAITGDFRKAIILNQFIYWSERVSDADKFIEKENEIAKSNGKEERELFYGWIYKTAEELSEEVMLGLSASQIRRYINDLVDLKYISKRTNPNYKWDRTLQYRVNLVNIAKSLKKKGYPLSDYKIEIPDDDLSNTHSCTINDEPGENQSQSSERAIPDTTTDTTNRDCVSENTDKYALEDEKQSSKGNIYASVPEEQEDYTSQKQNRYIPQDYTEEQLIKHIKQPICDYMKKEYGGMASEEMSDELIKIVMSFHRKYEGQYGKRHRVLSDKAYENIVDRYMNPPEEMTDDYSIETYEAMMERYFEVDYNKRGNYKGNITLGLSHFMSDSVRNNLYCQTCK